MFFNYIKRIMISQGKIRVTYWQNWKHLFLQTSSRRYYNTYYCSRKHLFNSNTEVSCIYILNNSIIVLAFQFTCVRPMSSMEQVRTWQLVKNVKLQDFMYNTILLLAHSFYWPVSLILLYHIGAFAFVLIHTHKFLEFIFQVWTWEKAVLV